jgi:Chlorophyll A-B binding protein
MLAITGVTVQQAGIHWPGSDIYLNTDIFGAPSSVGWGVNVQIFLFMCAVEIATFNKTFGEGEPGDFGLDGGQLSKMNSAQVKYRQESEIVHCRLAMIAIVAAVVQTLLFGKAFPF